jgi:hypothetical protein
MELPMECINDEYGKMSANIQMYIESEKRHGGLYPKLKTMVDIETLDIHPSNSIIIAIALVVFGIGNDIAQNEDQLVTYQVYLPIKEQLDMGRTITQDTLLFHLEHPVALYEWAQSMREEMKECDLHYSLLMLHDILINSDEIWVNGMNFDATNIATLFASVPEIKDKSIRYSVWRDYRTIAKEFKVDYKNFFIEEETQHCAIHDALAQTRALLYIQSKYRKSGE